MAADLDPEDERIMDSLEISITRVLCDAYVAEARAQSEIHVKTRVLQAVTEMQIQVEARAAAERHVRILQALAQAQALVRVQAEAQARFQAEAQARVQAQAQALAQAQAQFRAQAEAQARVQAEAQARVQAQAQAQAEAEAQARFKQLSGTMNRLFMVSGIVAYIAFPATFSVSNTFARLKDPSKTQQCAYNVFLVTSTFATFLSIVCLSLQLAIFPTHNGGYIHRLVRLARSFTGCSIVMLLVAAVSAWVALFQDTRLVVSCVVSCGIIIYITLVIARSMYPIPLHE